MFSSKIFVEQPFEDQPNDRGTQPSNDEAVVTVDDTEVHMSLRALSEKSVGDIGSALDEFASTLLDPIRTGRSKPKKVSVDLSFALDGGGNIYFFKARSKASIKLRLRW